MDFFLFLFWTYIFTNFCVKEFFFSFIVLVYQQKIFPGILKELNTLRYFIFKLNLILIFLCEYIINKLLNNYMVENMGKYFPSFKEI